MSKNYRAELVGAFGNPIDENPTGVMEEAAFAAKGLNFRYLTVKVEKDDLEAAMNGVKAFNMKGINLTIPHKVNVLKYLDELSEAASIIGAVNMVVNKDGKAIAHVRADGVEKRIFSPLLIVLCIGIGFTAILAIACIILIPILLHQKKKRVQKKGEKG